MQITIPYSPRKLQKFLHNQILKHRFNVIVAHRRSGKTVMCINHMIRDALTNEKPNPRYAFISPTFKQGKSTAWDYIKNFAKNIPFVKFNESELRCDFPNGARITILGAENDQALRGIFLDGCVMDETQSISPTIFPEIIRPALADRKGWCIFIGTPKGQNYFYKLHKEAQEQKDWWTGVFKASETNILDKEELISAQEMMSEDLYDQEFECSFQAAITGSYYGALIEDLQKNNRITSVPYDENLNTETWWDLGLKDSTAIWFVQKYRDDIYKASTRFSFDQSKNTVHEAAPIADPALLWWTADERRDQLARTEWVVALETKRRLLDEPRDPIPGESRRGLGIACEPSTPSIRAEKIAQHRRINVYLSRCDECQPRIPIRSYV